MRPVSQVGVRALPPASRVPWAHPCLARAMVISCSTLAVGSEPVVTGAGGDWRQVVMGAGGGWGAAGSTDDVFYAGVQP